MSCSLAVAALHRAFNIHLSVMYAFFFSSSCAFTIACIHAHTYTNYPILLCSMCMRAATMGQFGKIEWSVDSKAFEKQSTCLHWNGMGKFIHGRQIDCSTSIDKIIWVGVQVYVFYWRCVCHVNFSYSAQKRIEKTFKKMWWWCK